jgi:hypothetical protein
MGEIQLNGMVERLGCLTLLAGSLPLMADLQVESSGASLYIVYRLN